MHTAEGLMQRCGGDEAKGVEGGARGREGKEGVRGTEGKEKRDVT